MPSGLLLLGSGRGKGGPLGSPAPLLTAAAVVTNAGAEYLTLTFDRAVTASTAGGISVGWPPSEDLSATGYTSGAGTPTLTFSLSRRVFNSEGAGATVGYDPAGGGTIVGVTDGQPAQHVTGVAVTNNSTFLNPATLSPLLWYTAGGAYLFTDTGGTTPATDGIPVRRWNDRSGNGYHVYGDGTETAHNVSGVWNVSVGDGMKWNASLADGYSPFGTVNATAAEIFHVIRNTASGTQEAPGQWGSGTSGWYPFGTDVYTSFATNSRKGPYALGGIDPTAIHVLNYAGDNSSFVARIDTTVIGSEPNSVGWTPFAVFLRTGLGTCARAVHEVIGFDRILTDPQRAQLLDYFRYFWGTP